jgi:excalibur calcium-binding domain-containing protein/uncharacterized protein DUF1524
MLTSPFVCAVAVAALVAGLSGCATLPAVQSTPDVARRTTAVQQSEASDKPSHHRRTPRTATAHPTEAPSRVGTALGVLATLSVRGRAPMTGYSREAFGPAWLDANRNGCDERNDILTRDLGDRTEENCRVLTGTLTDPYTARGISYVYGDGSLIDIDHVVALGNAWVSGASRWPIRRRAALATDPLNLLAVDASANRQKGDGDAATWLPSNKAYRCSYVARQIAVKAKFGLSVTAAEDTAITRVLSTCPGQPVPPDSGAPPFVSNNITEPPTATTSPRTAAGGGTGTWYANCDAVRAAGAAPIHRGDPGYSTSLDGDADGSACE